jgi:hypothetical protein
MSGKRPVYARALRLRYLRPGGLLCFLYFEGSIALGVLLALAELAPWWGILLLPAAVAAMVKLNDSVAYNNARVRPAPAHVRTRPTPSGPALRASVPHARAADTAPPVSRTPSTGLPGSGTHTNGTPVREIRVATERDTHGDLRRGPNQRHF